jgi:hypothetical protein
MVVTICALTSSLLQMSRCAWTFSERRDLEPEQGYGVERSRAVRTLEFDSPACARYVNESSVSLQEAYATSVSFVFLQHYNESLHVCEEGKLERCRNACKAQSHYPKRPSVIKESL